MSLITCCPACGTMFRVVPDQLKISEGWVRCGHCAEVFDATANMSGDVPLPGPPPPALEADTEPGNVQAIAPSPPDSVLRASSLDQPFVFRRSDMGQDDDPHSVPEDFAPSSRPAVVHQDEDAAVQDVTFMQLARRRAFWRSPLVRALLGLLTLALAALLAAQFAVQERDRLAATEPALRPWLQQLCGLLDCRVEPPRQIETLAIDSSSFNRVRNDAYRLNFTLKNNAFMPVAIPAMELTLTDSQDQPVMRRVITPAELGASAPVIAAGGEWSTSVALAVNADTQGSRISGYRLLAFYP